MIKQSKSCAMGSYDFREDEINYLLVIIMIISKNGNNYKFKIMNDVNAIEILKRPSRNI